MKTIFITVLGGCIQEILSTFDTSDIQIVVKDFDNDTTDSIGVRFPIESFHEEINRINQSIEF